MRLMIGRSTGPRTGRRPLLASTAFAIVFALCAASGASEEEANALPAPARPNSAAASAAKSPVTAVGLLANSPGAFNGLTLIAPMTSTRTFLIDMQGQVVHSWECGCKPALGAALLENGHLIRPGALPEQEQTLPGPGAGGRIQEFDWHGKLVWDFKLASERQLPHHDVTRLPNGNLLVIVWSMKTRREAIAAGRRPGSVGNQLVSDSVLEIKPTGRTSGTIVWEWRLWDHLVQDFDKTKANYGRIAAHPELIDVNYGNQSAGTATARADDAARLRAIGYVGAKSPAAGSGGGPSDDWYGAYINSVSYNEQLDQVLLSVREFNEIWVIDHGTTTAEAARHSGGKRGRGGDILYRWGNPRAYRAGTNADQRLFAQHDARWIPKGFPGEGNVLVFNNGFGRPDGEYSTVDEIVLPLRDDGTYDRPNGGAYAPQGPVWSYAAPTKSDLYSMRLAGAQRLENENTLICAGMTGTVFEVTPEREIVWKYVVPARTSESPGRAGPGTAATRPGPDSGNPTPSEALFRSLRYPATYARPDTGSKPQPR